MNLINIINNIAERDGLTCVEGSVTSDKDVANKHYVPIAFWSKTRKNVIDAIFFNVKNEEDIGLYDNTIYLYFYSTEDELTIRKRIARFWKYQGFAEKVKKGEIKFEFSLINYDTAFYKDMKNVCDVINKEGKRNGVTFNLTPDTLSC